MDLSYNISYALAGLAISIIIILIVSLNYSSTNIVNKRYKLYLFASIGMIVLDIVTVITNDYPGYIPIWLNVFLNGLYFFSGTLTAMLFLFYCMTVAFPRPHKKTRILSYSINLGILGIYLLSLIINCFNGIYFYFDEAGSYSKGPIYLVVNLLSVIYVLECIIIIFVGKENFNKRQLFCAVLFLVSFFGAFLLQLFVFQTVLLSDFGCAIGSLIIFFSIETPDYVKLTTTLKELNDLKASLEEQVADRTQELQIEKASYQELTIETLSSLAVLIDAKDHYTKGHSTRVAKYAKALAIKCGLSEAEGEIIYFAGLIHDVGKIGISELIIRKPGPLTEEEYAIIKAHPAIGGDILKSIKKFKMFEAVARYHHERYDGNGYPKGLKLDNIPYEARIVAVCDTFDAMMSDRSYRRALPLEKARQELIDGKNTQFDGAIVEKFLELLDDPNFKIGD